MEKSIKKNVFSVVVFFILLFFVFIIPSYAEEDIENIEEKYDVTVENQEQDTDIIDSKNFKIEIEDNNFINNNSSTMIGNGLLSSGNSSSKTTTFPSELKNYDYYSEVLSDTENEWYVNDESGKVYFYKFNYSTNSFTKTYTYEYDKTKYSVMDYYTNDNIIYVLISNRTDNYIPTIIGYDVKQNKVVFNQTYEGAKQYVMNQQFIVDSHKRAYFKDDNSNILTYDENGLLLSIFVNADKTRFSMQNMNPDDKIMVLSVDYSYDGFLKVEDGVIKSEKITKYKYKYGYRYVSWKFLTNNLAVDTYGAVAEFDSDSNEISYNVIYSKERDTRINPVFKLNNYIFIGEDDGYILKINLDTIVIEARYQISNSNGIIMSANYNNGTYYVRYIVPVDGSDSEYIYYLESFTNNNVKPVNTYTFTTNTAKGHSKTEIINKYNSLSKKYDYSNSVYKEEPSTVNPYKAGLLQDQVIKDTLNQVNFYRWLYGENNVILNSEKMHRNQKGAVLMAVNKQLTHYPSKPSDMDEEFYNDGYAGCNASTDYSGCVGYGTSMPNSIYTYIDDSNNGMGDVGHRTNILDLAADSVSFGYCNSYNALSTYFSTNTSNNDNFYSYPTPGYFPINCISSKALWSITLKDNNYMFKNFKMKFTCNGKTVENTKAGYDVYTKTLYFNLPTEIKDMVKNGRGNYLPGEKISIEVSGIQDSIGDNYIIKYDTEFFLIGNPILPTSADISFDGSVYSNTTKKEMKPNETKTLYVFVRPSNVTDGRYIVVVSNNNGVVSYDETTREIKALNPGTAHFTIKSYSTENVLHEFDVVVSIPLTSISLNQTNITLDKGKSQTLSVIYNPTNTTVDRTVKWTSGNNNIATVDSNGKVTAKGKGTTTITAKVGTKSASCTVIVNEVKTLSIKYRTHVQNDGWQNYVYDGAMSGTSGRSLRLEGIKIALENQPYSGDIEYTTHVQYYGWQNYVKNDEMAGTSGESLRLEAIKIRLTGEMANHYDVYYRVHAQNVGWMNWAKNGEPSGTAGYSFRLEGIEIVIVKKGENPPQRDIINCDQAYKFTKVSYRTHVQNVGWQNYVYDGAMSGTSGQSLRLEGINIKLDNQEYSGNIEYATHVQYVGWQGFKKNNEMSGTSGQGLRLEAIKIRLTGEMAEHYDVYYCVHAQNFGWMGWAKNGESAGTAGYAYRLEGIRIVLVEKGGNAPGSTANSFAEKK